MPGVPPVPIPNTAVKPRAANGSRTIGPARVGCCQVYGPVLRKKSRASFFARTRESRSVILTPISSPAAILVERHPRRPARVDLGERALAVSAETLLSLMLRSNNFGRPMDVSSAPIESRVDVMRGVGWEITQRRRSSKYRSRVSFTRLPVRRFERDCAVEVRKVLHSRTRQRAWEQRARSSKLR